MLGTRTHESSFEWLLTSVNSDRRSFDSCQFCVRCESRTCKVDSYEGWINPATQSLMPLASELSGRWEPLDTCLLVSRSY